MTDDRPYRGLFGARPPPTKGLLDDLFPSNPFGLLSPPPQSPLGLISRLLDPSPPTPSADALRLANALRMTAPAPAPSPLVNALANALRMTAPPPAPSPLANALLGMMTDEPKGLARFTGVPPNALASGLGSGLIPRPMTDPTHLFNPAPATKPYLPPVNRTPTKTYLPDVRRRTFFSFHFDDVMRVNQVRKSWKIRPATADPRAPLWFQDSSIWEESKETDDATLEGVIRDGLDRTSVTCFLAGEETWSRPWVRFEIGASVERGNGLLTVYIHGVRHPTTGVSNPGHNPLDFMGVYEKPTGGFYLCEKGYDGQWYAYDKIRGPVRWPSYLPKTVGVNVAQPLSAGAKVYDYARNGYANLSIWVQAAAVAAGK